MGIVVILVAAVAVIVSNNSSNKRRNSNSSNFINDNCRKKCYSVFFQDPVLFLSLSEICLL